MHYGTATSSTLIERIRNPSDEEAWERFARFYQPLILRFARGYGCDPHMCRDVAQETLVDLLTIMPRFAYDRERGRFRAFLYQVVRRRAKSAFRQRRQQTPPGESDSEAAVADPGEPAPEVSEDAWELEWRRQLFLEALVRLRERVRPTSYAAFHAYAVQGEAADHVCEHFHLTTNALHQIRHRLFATLRQLVAEIEAELDEAHRRG